MGALATDCLACILINLYSLPVWNTFFFIILGGYGHTGKWIQENIIFMRFCCCFKLSKKTEKLLNEQLTHIIAKCTLTGLVQQAKKSCQKWDLKSHMCILHNIASSSHCHICQLEFKMLLPPAKKQKTPACLREIQVHKLWTKVYSKKGLTAMQNLDSRCMINCVCGEGAETNSETCSMYTCTDVCPIIKPL